MNVSLRRIAFAVLAVAAASFSVVADQKVQQSILDAYTENPTTIVVQVRLLPPEAWDDAAAWRVEPGTRVAKAENLVRGKRRAAWFRLTMAEPLAPKGKYTVTVGGLAPLAIKSLAERSMKWRADLDRFAAEDAKALPPKGCVLLIGSSSFAMWKSSAADFAPVTVVNRGFGGSTLAEQVVAVERVVYPYSPSRIFVYCGENDISGGRTPEGVRDDFAAWVKLVRDKFPTVPITYCSMKYSRLRVHYVEKMRRGNELIRAYCAANRGLSYLDIATPLLGADGQPREDLFLNDKLHLNRKGYEVWIPLFKAMMR